MLGGVTGDSGYAVAVSSEIGKRAVENNNLAAVGRLATFACSQACLQGVVDFLGLGIIVGLSDSDKESAYFVGFNQDPEAISKLTDEQREYLNQQILNKEFGLGDKVWIRTSSGGFAQVDPDLVVTHTGGQDFIDPRIFVNDTGGIQYPDGFDIPNHTGGEQVADQHPSVMPYEPKPKTDEITGFDGLKPAKPKTTVQGGGGKRARWKDKDGKIYEWDSRHGELEKYDKHGKHEGAFDHKTGKKLKDADPKRKVEP